MERSSLSRLVSACLLGAVLFTALIFVPFSASALTPIDPPSVIDKLPGAASPVVTTIGEDIPKKVDTAYQNIRWQILGAGTMAFMNAMQTFFGQVAYDAADYLATGGKGQSALYYKKGFQEYLKDVGGSAAGEFIGSISQESFFRTIGFDLCRPPDPKNLLRIQLSLGQFLPGGISPAYQRPQAKCAFNDIIQNYEQVYQTLSNGDVLKNVDASLNTNANDLGVSFLIFNRAQEFVYRRQDASEKDRKEGNGYQGLRDMISGRIKTPAETIREEANQITVKDPKANQQSINEFILNQAWNLGPIRLATYTASVFLNTFTSRMLGRIFEGGIDQFDPFKQKAVANFNSADDLLVGNAEDIRKANIDLRTPNLFQDRAYDVISEMQTCPENRGTWNCTIDEGFSQALHSDGTRGSFTIREALERGYLKKSWRLYPSSSQREERDPLCYTYGYCAGNLKKLRLMRMIPVGFEFVANDPKNVERCSTDRGCVTLGEAVGGYTNCNEQGQKDADHPWCKLIDPNWALTSFPQQCALTGFGDSILAEGLPQRREECQDIQTCLRRNDAGECVGGYGQCVAEKAVYRFGGEECSARYASCRSYGTRTEGADVSYLRNTLDYARCSEDNVGCLWYATKRDPGSLAPNPWIGTVTEGDRVYFDKTMETCEASGEGCTRLLAVKEGEKALNLIANSSFEQISAAGSLESWAPIQGEARGFVRPNVTQGEASADGTTGAGFSGGFIGGYRQVVDLQPGHNYVISGFVRGMGTAAPTMRLGIRQFGSRADALSRTAPLAADVLRRDYSTTGCALVASAGDFNGALIARDAGTVAQSAVWSRVECGFTADALTKAGEILIQGEGALADAVMLEEGAVAGRYIDGVNASLETVYHKISPEEYACKGDASDPAICANFASVCRQTEAGCDGYTDTNGVFPEVAAQLNNKDACPATCVGYAEYRKLASSFDLVQSVVPETNDATEPRAANFIPTTAEQCTQEAVGCEEFTGVDAVAEGGEAKSYFTSLRFCEKPSDDTATYFTWEGSDSAGYQLRTWSMKKRTADKPGDVPPEGIAIAAAAGPRIAIKRSGNLSSQVDPANCTEANWRTGEDRDCRQFYDASGQTFYRYYSQTVLSTNDCRSYRLASNSADDCSKTGGTYNASQRACIYQAYAPESGSCTANYAGCRAFAGAEAGNLRTVLSLNGSSLTGVEGARASSESLIVGDESYRADTSPRGTTNQATISTTFSSARSGLYRVLFWAKSSAPTTVLIRALTEDGSDPRLVGTARLTADWQQVSIGLLEGSVGAKTQLRFTASAEGSAPTAFFLDEIVVQQLRDVVFVRQGTWNTPNTCDQNAYSIPEPQAMLGCREYRNRNGETVNARQFSQLCRPQAIGCREFIDTRNSTQPYRQAFTQNEAAGPFVTERAASRYVYVIDDKSRRCTASDATCRAFGKPLLKEDRQVVDRYETVYLKDDVTKYGEGLCKPSELFCEEFSTNGGVEYFKDPQNHTCEFRDQVAVDSVRGVPDGTYSGWFVTGKNTPCYPNALATGQLFQVLRTGDTTPAPGYEGWGATCPAEQTECTEFRDTNDKTSGNTIGRPYYFIKNDQIDLSSCNGTVDPAHGCVLLRNMAKAGLTYSTEATLKAYQNANLQAVQAVDCQSDPTQDGCGATRSGRCTGTKVTRRFQVSAGGGGLTLESSQSAPYVGGSCAQESDCLGEAATTTRGRALTYYGAAGRFVLPMTAPEIDVHVDGIRCDRQNLNDANEVAKVSLDRDCAQWLGCATGETVYDPSTNRYRDICTKYALCDKGSESGSNAASYCSNYVNRSSSSTEPILTSGAYFNAQQYTSRPAGVGARDYSGYTLPNAFQVVDLQSRSISKDLSKTEVSGGQDQQRLVVAVKMPPIDSATINSRGNYQHLVPPTGPNQAEVIPRNSPLYQSIDNQEIFLCRHRGTGIVGYFLKSDMQRPGQEINCYLSFRGTQEANTFVALNNRLETNAGAQDLTLDQNYPRSLCRAYPESDAPYSSDVVTKWDLTTNPISPLEVRAGYQDVNTCAYGEDCTCSYKRVEYPGLYRPKFFATNSQAVSPGICVGGPRAGQSCLPSDVFDISSSTSTSAQAAQAANNAQSCGAPNGGGQCIAFGKAEIIRGVMGSCLEYDTTHGRGTLGNETFPCLVWNPSPIIGGESDPYHYVQTAGYFPPQNAGQYYCSSKARPPTKYRMSAGDFSALPSGVAILDYHDALVSDGSGTLASTITAISGSFSANALLSTLNNANNVAGAYFNGQRPEGSNAATQCEDADDDQDDDGNYDMDPLGLRLVSTGRGEDASYTETFYRLSPKGYAASLNRTDANLTTDEQRKQAMIDQNISYIEVKPFKNPNGNGRLACGYQQDWVDGVNVSDYDTLDETGPADRQWHQAFLAEEDLQTYLTRGNEEILTTVPAGSGATTAAQPLKMPCVNMSDGTPPGDGAELLQGTQCYFKTWTIGYRDDGKKAFVGFLPNSEGFDTRERVEAGFDGLREPVYEKCDSEKPYYAIRAVFQTDASIQGMPEETPIASNLRGPWRMVGFWVSACGGRGQTDNRFIYMNVTIQNADICRELVEVRSKDSNQDAAFTDRIWKESKYSVPILGIQYGQSFAPFSSALNTGSAGVDPLYQTGGKLAGSSAIRPPTFLASGYQTYYGPITPGAPRDKYAYLSNLFARIYRVYHYNEQRITASDKICTSGPNLGRKCVPDAVGSAQVPTTGPSVDCRPLSGAAACDTNEPPPLDLKLCNALSGINTGRSCKGKEASCHSYASNPDPAVTRSQPLLTGCHLQPGWTLLSSGRYQSPSTAPTNGAIETARNAAGHKAFRCATGAVRLAYNSRPEETIFCTKEDARSAECPIEVTGACVKPPSANKAADIGKCLVSWQGRTAPVSTAVSCRMNEECSFTRDNFWRVPVGAHYPSDLDLDPDPEDVVCASPDTGIYGDRFNGRWGIVMPTRGIMGEGVYVSLTNPGSATRSCTVCPGGECQAYSAGMVARSTIQYVTSTSEMIEHFTSIGLSYNVLEPTSFATDTNRFPGALVAGGGISLPENPIGSWSMNPSPLVRVDVNNRNVANCESLTQLMEPHRSLFQLGTCTNGTERQGNACLRPVTGATFTADTAYLRSWVTSTQCSVGAAVNPSQYLCEPVSTPALTPTAACALPSRDGRSQTAADYYADRGITSQNLNNDNNRCTSEVGYQVDPAICPDPTSEFCGLITYDMRAQDATPGSLASTNVPLPTDVTLGYYTPSFLGLPTSLAAASSYEYIDYYTPRPPRIAAPVARCPEGSSCGVQDLDKFSFNGITQGIVNVVGGQYRSVIKFYGWAAHEQMSLRQLSVDWGDGTIQDFSDVKLKNHKPFCSVTKECYSPTDGFTGLTCESNNECPLQAQACRSMGSCKDKKNLVCAQDSDCRRDGSTDSCDVRSFFGNSVDACEASPFEYAHVYACPASAPSMLPRCSGQNFTSPTSGSVTFNGVADVFAPAGGRAGTCFFGAVDSLAVDGRARPTCTATGAAGATECRAAYARIFNITDTSREGTQFPATIQDGISCGPPTQASGVRPVNGSGPTVIPVVQSRCSGDTSRFCRVNTATETYNDCAAGDTCIEAALAPPNGCWDDQNNACRFTPRVFLQDNWGWCTGECRSEKVGDTLQDNASSLVRHAYGGCYTPVPVGADERKETARLNTDLSSAVSSLAGWNGTEAIKDTVNIECRTDRPNGALPSTDADRRRNFRPWIVFPGSIQIRPRN